MLHNDTEKCPNGSNITDDESCREACNELKITIGEIETGYVCYKNVHGYCYQDGQIKEGDSLVCEKIILNQYIV